MNNKGFTLVELLATIVILGIISGIAVVSFTSISGKIRGNQYDNLKKRIEVSATNYYNDTKMTSFKVQDLIDYGLLQTDDNEGLIRDPRDDSSLNDEEISCSVSACSLNKN